METVEYEKVRIIKCEECGEDMVVSEKEIKQMKPWEYIMCGTCGANNGNPNIPDYNIDDEISETIEELRDKTLYLTAQKASLTSQNERLIKENTELKERLKNIGKEDIKYSITN